jgi:hypothetical protein
MTRERLAALRARAGVQFEGRLERAADALAAIDVIGQALVDGRLDLAEAHAPRLLDEGAFDDFEVVEADLWRARCRELHLVLDRLGAIATGSLLTRLGELLGRARVVMPKTGRSLWRSRARARFRHGAWVRLGPVVFHASRARIERLDADWATVEGSRALVHVLEDLGVAVPAHRAAALPGPSPGVTPSSSAPSPKGPRALRPVEPWVDRSGKVAQPVDAQWRARPPFVVFRPPRALKRLGRVLGPVLLGTGLLAVGGGLITPALAFVGALAFLTVFTAVIFSLEP